MSGIVGSRHNIRGSGLVGSLGTDGQVFTSAGAGTGAVFEDAAGGGSMNLIKTLTLSGDDDLSFVNGSAGVVLDSTYNVYVFTFSHIHGSVINYVLQWNGSTDTGSSYDVSKTQFANRTSKCSGSSHAPVDDTGESLHRGTGGAHMNNSLGIDANECCAGQLRIFNPSNTTFYKMYDSWTGNTHSGSDCFYGWITGGMIETTSAVDAIQFSMTESATMDAGVISMYGITK